MTLNVRLHTGQVHFAPLVSSSRFQWILADAPHFDRPLDLGQPSSRTRRSPSEARAERQKFVKAFHASNPSLPLPVSPKSLYALSHLMGVRPLQQLALQALWLELDQTNILGTFEQILVADQRIP